LEREILRLGLGVERINVRDGFDEIELRRSLADKQLEVTLSAVPKGGRRVHGGRRRRRHPLPEPGRRAGASSSPDGFLFGEPVPADDLAEMLRTRKADPATSSTPLSQLTAVRRLRRNRISSRVVDGWGRYRGRPMVLWR